MVYYSICSESRLVSVSWISPAGASHDTPGPTWSKTPAAVFPKNTHGFFGL